MVGKRLSEDTTTPPKNHAIADQCLRARHVGAPNRIIDLRGFIDVGEGQRHHDSLGLDLFDDLLEGDMLAREFNLVPRPSCQRDPCILVEKNDTGHIVRDRKSNTSELQSLMRISYAVFCLKKKKKKDKNTHQIPL